VHLNNSSNEPKEDIDVTDRGPIPKLVTSYDELRKMSRRELKELSNTFLGYAAEAKTVEERTELSTQSNYYVAELGRRRDTRISTRDLILEVVVIGLIGWEIWMGYRQEGDQSKNFDAQQVVLGHMQTSTQATATTLVEVESTMKAMKDSIDKQVGLFYDVQINVTYAENRKKLVLQNTGRSNVTLWAQHVGTSTDPMLKFPEPHVIVPTATYEITLEDAITLLTSKLPRDQMQTFTFMFLVKNERHEKFTISGDLIASWRAESISLNIPIIAISPGWDTTQPLTPVELPK
jgi:hypothetical protein